MTRTRVLGLASTCLVVALQGGVDAASAHSAHVARSNPVTVARVVGTNHALRAHEWISNPAPVTRVAAPAAAGSHPITLTQHADLGADPVTLTKHEDLGFSTSIPVSVDTGIASPPCLLTVVVCLFHGAVAFTGTLQVRVKLATDVALSYDPADLNTPSGPLPVSITYTPTPGGSTATYSLKGNLTLNFDGCSGTGCDTPLSVSA